MQISLISRTIFVKSSHSILTLFLISLTFMIVLFLKIYFYELGKKFLSLSEDKVKALLLFSQRDVIFSTHFMSVIRSWTSVTAQQISLIYVYIFLICQVHTMNS